MLVLLNRKNNKTAYLEMGIVSSFFKRKKNFMNDRVVQEKTMDEWFGSFREMKNYRLLKTNEK